MRTASAGPGCIELAFELAFREAHPLISFDKLALLSQFAIFAGPPRDGRGAVLSNSAGECHRWLRFAAICATLTISRFPIRMLGTRQLSSIDS